MRESRARSALSVAMSQPRGKPALVERRKVVERHAVMQRSTRLELPPEMRNSGSTPSRSVATRSLELGSGREAAHVGHGMRALEHRHAPARAAAADPT